VISFKRIMLLIIVGMFYCLLWSMPDWEITVYPTSTVAYGNVTIEGQAADHGDIVYAFVLQECRGKQPVKIHEGNAYMPMNIQGMDDNEPVYFRIWDASEDDLFHVNFSTRTKPNKDIGYPPDVLPINGVKDAVTFFFPPEQLEMGIYEIRQLDIGYYCNTTENISDIRIFGNDNLEVVPDGFTVNISEVTGWTGEEEIEIELINEAGEVIEYGDVLIIVISQ
jgi:hypothetical protein